MKRTYPVHLLITGASVQAADRMVSALREARLTVRPRLVNRAGALVAALDERPWELVLAGTAAPEGLSPEQVAELVTRHRRDAPVIAVHAGDGDAQAAIRGVADAVGLDSPDALVRAARRELRHVREHRALAAARSALSDLTRTVHELMDEAPEPVAFVAHGALIRTNEAFRSRFGFEVTAELRGVPLADCVAEGDREALEAALADDTAQAAGAVVLSLDGQDRAGATFPMQLELTPMILERQRGVRATVREAHRQRAGAPAVTAAAAPAPGGTTVLPGREVVLQALSEHLTGAAAGAAADRLVVLLLANHAELRREAGILAVERLVHDAAGRLRAALPAGAVWARIADDAFAVLVPAAAELHAAASTLAAALGGAEYRTGTRTLVLSCQAAALELAGSDAAALLDRAFREVVELPQRALAAGTASVPDEDTVRDVAAELLGCMREERLSLVYQPIVRLHGEPLELYEVFLRLRARDGTPIAPGTFLPVAEHEGFIGELDEWLIDQVCRVLGERHAAGRGTHLFVKLSRQALGVMEIPIRIRRALRRAGVAPRHLTVEISEAAAAGNIREARAFMHSLHEIGCRTALEHFGVNLDSFRLIEELGAEFVKIDASLVADLAGDEQAKARVREIARAVHARGSHTIAENLEDPRALAALFDCGVEFAQGYYIQEPTAEPEFEFDIELG